MKYNKTLMQIIEESAIELTDSGKTEFTRMDIYNQAKMKYPDIKKCSLDPIIQGMTKNLKGGGSGSTVKNVFLSNGKGEFHLIKND